MTEEANNNGKRFVRWQIFVWAIGVILLLFSVSFGVISNGNTNNKEQLNETKTDVNELKKDNTDFKVFMGATGETLKNIDKTLIRIEGQINKK